MGSPEHHPLPRIRPLEILRLSEEGAADSYLLRDPEGYTDEELVLSEAALFVAAHADGIQTLADIRDRFERRYGSTPSDAEIRGLFSRLDGAHMLETPAFMERRTRLQTDFEQAPLRLPSHAGVSYPAEPNEVDSLLEGFLAEADGLEEEGSRPPGELRGLVAPHIDIRVGGTCMALPYRLLEETPRVETVVVLGTAHGCPYPAWIVTEKPFATPLGTVPVDEEGARRLAAVCATDNADLFHHRREHSIEFQALFLAKLRRRGRDLRMIPVLCGSLRPAPSESPSAKTPVPTSDHPFLVELGRFLQESEGRAVVLAAADLAHVGTRFGDSAPLSERHLELLDGKDRQTLRTVTEGDPRAFFEAVMDSGDPRRICGLSPIFAALSVLPAVRGKVLCYRQATDPDGTVSYASVGLWGPPAEA